MSETTIHCSHCQAELILEEQFLGQEVTCPVCGKNFTAGKKEEPEELAELEELPENEELAELEEVKEAKAPAPAGPGAKTFKLNLKNLQFSSLMKKKEEKLVSIDDDEGNNENDFSAIEESDDEDNLLEPEIGFITIKKFGGAWLILGILAVVSLIVGVVCLIHGIDDERGYEIVLGILSIGICLALAWGTWKAWNENPSEKIWKRDLIKQYFDAEEKVGFCMRAVEFIFDLLDNIPFITFFTHIISGIATASAEEYRKKRVPYYDEVQELDLEYLQKLNVLHRFGKDKTQLVSKMETLFAPAFDGVGDLEPYASQVEEDDEIYRYNLEEVTKIYTFEDQLFLYTGVWDYCLGKMIKEKTEAFFFKDITDIATESKYKISTKYVESGCLSMFIPWFGKKIRTVYKESDGFVLTSSSGNQLSITIGFEDFIAASGATYTHRSDNERVIHAIRKMIEEKKVVKNG